MSGPPPRRAARCRPPLPPLRATYAPWLYLGGHAALRRREAPTGVLARRCDGMSSDPPCALTLRGAACTGGTLWTTAAAPAGRRGRSSRPFGVALRTAAAARRPSVCAAEMARCAAKRAVALPSSSDVSVRTNTPRSARTRCSSVQLGSLTSKHCTVTMRDTAYDMLTTPRWRVASAADAHTKPTATPRVSSRTPPTRGAAAMTSPPPPRNTTYFEPACGAMPFTASRNAGCTHGRGDGSHGRALRGGVAQLGVHHLAKRVHVARRAKHAARDSRRRHRRVYLSGAVPAAPGASPDAWKQVSAAHALIAPEQTAHLWMHTPRADRPLAPPHARQPSASVAAMAASAAAATLAAQQVERQTRRYRRPRALPVQQHAQQTHRRPVHHEVQARRAPAALARHVHGWQRPMELDRQLRLPRRRARVGVVLPGRPAPRVMRRRAIGPETRRMHNVGANAAARGL